MTKCPNCNAELTDDAKFCTKCGTKIVNQKVCPSCGKQLPNDAKFCVFCGASCSEETHNNASLIKCPECGRQISESANLCPHCGVEFGTCGKCGGKVKMYSTSCPHCGVRLEWKQTKETKESKDVEEFITGCLTLIIVVVGLWFLFGKSSCSHEDDSDATSIFSSDSKSDPFMTVGDKSVYVATFDADFTSLMTKATITLYKDGSGTFDSDMGSGDYPNQCRWGMTGVTTPISEGGDGEPQEAIKIVYAGMEFVICKDHKIRGGDGASGYAVMGTVQKK